MVYKIDDPNAEWDAKALYIRGQVFASYIYSKVWYMSLTWK